MTKNEYIASIMLEAADLLKEDDKNKEKNIRKIISKISSYGKSENCQLCAGCFEMQMRGIDMVPRQVLSPRDVIFKDNKWQFLKNCRRISLSNYSENQKDLIKKIVLKHGPGSRYYVHVRWLGDDGKLAGGHIFNIINLDNVVYIVDCQDNVFIPIDRDRKYFNKISLKHTSLVRTDTLEIDKDLLKYNDSKYSIPWKDGDEKYLYLTE